MNRKRRLQILCIITLALVFTTSWSLVRLKWLQEHSICGWCALNGAYASEESARNYYAWLVEGQAHTLSALIGGSLAVFSGLTVAFEAENMKTKDMPKKDI